MRGFDRALEFSKSLGFSNTAEAIHSLGIFEFRKQSKIFKPAKIIKTTKVKPVIKFIPKAKEVTPIALGDYKPLCFDENYHIYNDGRLFSVKANRFLKGKTQRGYLLYELGKGNKYMASRLVYFHFCTHNRNKIEELNQISTKDKNPKNLWWQNLEELSKKEILKKHKIIGKPQNKKTINKRVKIKEIETSLIQKLIDAKFSLKKISQLYDTSEMSVHRFLKRHKINLSV